MSPQDERHPRELLSAWLDGELGASDRARVEAHLGGCAECKSLLADLRTLLRAVAGETTPEPSADLAARISECVRTEGIVGTMRRPAPRRQRAIPWSFAGSLAAAGILIAIVLKAGLEPPLLQEPRQMNKVAATAPDQKPEEVERPIDRDEEVAAAKTERKDLPAKRKQDALSAPEASRLEALGHIGGKVANLEKGRAAGTTGKPEGLEDVSRERDLPAPAAAPSPPPAAEAQAAATGGRDAVRESAMERRVNVAQAPAAGSLLQGRTKTAAHALCRAAWESRAGEPPVVVFLGLGTDESIAAHVAKLPGRWERLTTGAASTYRFEIERARWPELRRGLAELGARNLPAEDAPPPAVECVRLTVIFETVAE